MRKIVPPNFEFNYLDAPESEIKVKRAYKKIFDIARENIIKRRKNKMRGGETYVQRRNDQYIN
jgi:hypothetical protein